MVQQAKERLEDAYVDKHNMKRRTELKLGDVMKPLPWPADTFDAVFHVNVYYFWPNCTQALKNLHKVMKPNGRIVTTLNRDMLDKVVEAGLFNATQTNAHVTYIAGLKEAGFRDIVLDENCTDEESGFSYHLISAIK